MSRADEVGWLILYMYNIASAYVAIFNCAFYNALVGSSSYEIASDSSSFLISKTSI